MNRTRFLKIAYPVVVVAAVSGSIALMTVGDGGWGLIAFLLLLASGTVQRAVYRDFYTGRRLFAEGSFAEAIACFETFLAKIRRRPALRHLVWAQWAVHTPSIEAMTLNNLGSAAMGLGDLDGSEAWLREAVRVDPRYAVPWYNLSLLAAHRGDDAEAERLLAEAHRLGYTDSRDQALQRAGTGLARLEGRDPAD